MVVSILCMRIKVLRAIVREVSIIEAFQGRKLEEECQFVVFGSITPHIHVSFNELPLFSLGVSIALSGKMSEET